MYCATTWGSSAPRRRAAGATAERAPCWWGDRAVPSCLVLAARVDEPVRTVEGIAADAARLRQAFADRGGLQCGYCTPGLVVRAYQLIATGECGGSDRDAIRRALAGNFCRCTGYSGIVAAVADANADTMPT